MVSNKDVEIILKEKVQSYIDKNHPGIEFRIIRFDSEKEYRDLTGYDHWSHGYVIEFHGKGTKQQATLSDVSLEIFATRGHSNLIDRIENQTRFCIRLLLDKINKG